MKLSPKLMSPFSPRGKVSTLIVRPDAKAEGRISSSTATGGGLGVTEEALLREDSATATDDACIGEIEGINAGILLVKRVGRSH